MMQINIPGHAELIHKLFIHCTQYGSNYQGLTVRHLTSFIKNPSNTSTPFINLNVLANTLPFICLSAFKYDIYYYYDSRLPNDQERTAFPYYILCTNGILFLSGDSKTALLCRGAELIHHFQNQFDESLHNAIPLITSCCQKEEVLPNVIYPDYKEDPVYLLKYQPCLITYMTEKQLIDYFNSAIPNCRNYGPSIRYHIQQMHDMEYTCFFSKAGLLDFTANGIFSNDSLNEIPAIKTQDRLFLLESLYKMIESDRQNHRMINPVTFSLSERLAITLRSNYFLDFNYKNLLKTQCSCIHLTEGTLVEAFSDFFSYLGHSLYVYSKEDTLTCIRECIEHLRA